MKSPSSKILIDTGILHLYFAGDAKVKRFFNEIVTGKSEGLICESILTEFYYKTCISLGKAVADTRYFQLRRQKNLTITTQNEKITHLMGQLKCEHWSKLSLVDCCAAATAKIYKAKLVTTDHALAEVAKSEKIRTEIYELP